MVLWNNFKLTEGEMENLKLHEKNLGKQEFFKKIGMLYTTTYSS